jgi:hypothetical protein
MINTEDKASWCKHGEEQERLFAGPLLGGGCAVFTNPAKAEDKYTHDLFVVLPSDLKTVGTRFNSAFKLYGIPAESAITINAKDIDRYSAKYPHIIVIFDIDFGDFKRLCYASLRDLKRAIKLGKAKLHVYEKRRDDTDGNAKESWVMDSMWFQEFKR